MREVTLDLDCDLTEAEVNERAQLQASAMIEYDKVEQEKKDATKEFTDQMKELRMKMSALSEVINHKAERRPVVCHVRFHNPEPNMKRVIRVDTGELVRDEPMSAQERQQNLFDDVGELNRLYNNEAPGGDSPAA
jgi:hypothetical protein